MKLSVVIPAFNEAESMPSLLAELVPVCDSFSPFEIICVDDGSSDATYQVLCQQKERYPSLKIVKLECHSGKSAALAAGFDIASAEYVVTVDADLQNDPNDIPKLLALLDENDAVLGRRSNRRTTFLRRSLSRVGNLLLRACFRTNARDFGCGLKAFRKTALEKMVYFEGMHRFFPALLAIEECSVAEVLILERPRKYGKSRYGNLGRVFVVVVDLFAVIWLRNRKINSRIKSVD